jgi:plastocyanin
MFAAKPDGHGPGVGSRDTTEVYHRDDEPYSLRIPRGASSEVLPGEDFEVTLAAEGVYDCVCAPHEHAGMVGRLIVVQPTSHTRFVLRLL